MDPKDQHTDEQTLQLLSCHVLPIKCSSISLPAWSSECPISLSRTHSWYFSCRPQSREVDLFLSVVLNTKKRGMETGKCTAIRHVTQLYQSVCFEFCFCISFLMASWEEVDWVHPCLNPNMLKYSSFESKA